jgi:hypothetical protein
MHQYRETAALGSASPVEQPHITHAVIWERDQISIHAISILPVNNHKEIGSQLRVIGGMQ